MRLIDPDPSEALKRTPLLRAPQERNNEVVEAQRLAEAKREEAREAAAREVANKPQAGGEEAAEEDESKPRQSRHEQALADAAKLETGGEGDSEGNQVR